MKKTLALVLAFALVFSTMTVAFAEDAAIGADAKVCSDLGMLKGATGTVDAAYLATVPNRLQAAVMFLRLKGLEAEANAFTGTENFADADKVNWGKPVMAYLKAHPELGWVGDGTNFNPAGTMTAQAYYKVMLEALGYKQNTATVVGDFTWENVITFAAGKGLTKVAAVTNFTVNDLAAATVEALKANVKDTTKTLVATLVEAGKVDAAKATATGVYTATTTTAAALDSVVATANDKVEVTFDADADKAFAENVANYSIVVKGSTTALEVKAAKAVSATMVELTTAAQTGGTAYTLKVGTVSVNFAGLAKNTGAPEVDTVSCIDTNTVEVVFTKAMDRASVEDVANYTLSNGATVKAAELWIDQDDSRKTVKLTTDGVKNSAIYKLTIANVKSADLVAIKSVGKNFPGKTDTTAPKISGNVIVANNQRIIVVFDDSHGVDKASAENIANWSIDGLKINSIVAKDYIEYPEGTYRGLLDDYGYVDAVEINTDPMEANQKYTLTISNLIDGSTAKNAIAKVLTKTFYGIAVDKTAPTVGAFTVSGDNMIEIPFTENSRLDVASATDINNYTFDEGLKVLSASIIRSSAPDTTLGKTVLLTTSTMDTDTTYRLTIENVADEFGNTMTKVSNRTVPRSTGADIKAPAVDHTVWSDKNTVYVWFDERLDVTSANEPSNYTFNNGIGTVKSAAISSSKGYKRVTLTTPELAPNTNYTITINGVKDRVGNEMSNVKAYVATGLTSASTKAPTIENIVAVNQDEIRVTFNKPVNAASTARMTYHLNGGPLTADVVGVFSSNYTIDGNTTVVFKTAAPLASVDKYTLDSLIGITDKTNNAYVVDTADKPTFYGNADENDAPTVVAIDQTDVKTLKVTFSEPVIAPATIDIFDAVVDVDDDETTDALSVVTLTTTDDSVIDYDTDFTLDFSTVEDYAGAASTDEEYAYTAYLEDEVDPTIDYVEAVSTTKIQVHFSEEMDVAGTYVIKDADGDVVATTNPSAVVYSLDKTIVNITFTNTKTNNVYKVVPGDVYTLVPKTAAKDIAGNSLDYSDLSFDFVASAVTTTNYITGVKVIDSRTLEVDTTVALDTTDSDGITVVVDGTATNLVDTTKNVATPDPNDDTLAIVNGISGNATKYLTVYLKTPMLDGTTYKVATTGAFAGTFTVTGLTSDGGIDVSSLGIVTFSGWNVTGYVVKVIYAADSETYLVLPSTTSASTAKFDMATMAIEGTPGSTLDFADMTGAYTVEVYRTTQALTPAEFGNATDYDTEVTGKMEAAPVYTIETEK